MVSPDFKFVRRDCVRSTPEYDFDIDVYERASGEQFLLAHLLFHRWSPSVFKQVIREWRLFRDIVKTPLFACPKVDDERWVKFVTRTGWRYLQRVTCINGAERPLYIHTV